MSNQHRDGLYDQLEARVMERDQPGASDVFYELIRDGRPAKEILGQAVRIHAPYTHVPYHERIDQGYVNFVNNDHCLLSARVATRFGDFLPEDYAFLPLAQTIWYIPSGLDIWNQKLLKAPGHYTRGYKPLEGKPPPAPVVHWPDQEPLVKNSPIDEQLDEWLELVHRGQVLESYRLFLGMMEDEKNRDKVLGQLVFAGLIDVQDRLLYNRSYTTGHKSFRARATVELCEYLGGDMAHHAIYAGAPDIAVGPRWYSTYEMACNVVKMLVTEERLTSATTRGASEPELKLLDQTGELSEDEENALVHVLLEEPEPAYLHHIAGLLKDGKGLIAIMDALQVAAAEVLLVTGDKRNFATSQHCYEYCNTMRWFFGKFDHPQKVKLLFVAASFINRSYHHQRHTEGFGHGETAVPAGASKLSEDDLLERLTASLLAIESDASVAWTRACLEQAVDETKLIGALALAAAKIGNDPHNQELGSCTIEDYLQSTAHDKGRLLLGAARHTAGHIKYGDTFECYNRFAEAFDLPPQAPPGEDKIWTSIAGAKPNAKQ